MEAARFELWAASRLKIAPKLVAQGSQLRALNPPTPSALELLSSHRLDPRLP
jgi:hypothetical protein